MKSKYEHELSTFITLSYFRLTMIIEKLIELLTPWRFLKSSQLVPGVKFRYRYTSAVYSITDYANGKIDCCLCERYGRKIYNGERVVFDLASLQGFAMKHKDYES